MFGNKKVKRDAVDMTLSELLDKYVNTNYVSVDYRPNGTVNVWISPKENKEGHDDKQHT